MEKKTAFVIVRVTEELKKKLVKKAAGNLSALVVPKLEELVA